MRCIAWSFLISRSDMHATYSITRLLLFLNLAGISTGCLFLSISLETKGTQDTFWNVLLKTISVRWCIFYSAATKCCWNMLKNYSQIIFYSCLGFLACRYNIDTHDYDVRLRAAQRFLKDGDKVSNALTFHSHHLGANLQSEPYNQVAWLLNHYIIAGPCCHACYTIWADIKGECK